MVHSCSGQPSSQSVSACLITVFAALELSAPTLTTHLGFLLHTWTLTRLCPHGQIRYSGLCLLLSCKACWFEPWKPLNDLSGLMQRAQEWHETMRLICVRLHDLHIDLGRLGAGSRAPALNPVLWLFSTLTTNYFMSWSPFVLKGEQIDSFFLKSLISIKQKKDTTFLIKLSGSSCSFVSNVYTIL